MLSMKINQRWTGLTVFSILTVLFVLSNCCRATDLAQRVDGTITTDFTIVYSVRITDKLRNETRKQIADQVNQWYEARKSSKTAEVLPESVKQEYTDRITSIAQHTPKQLVIEISERGNKLLVKQFVPEFKRLQTFVYDGQRSMITDRGSDAQIYPGFNYIYVRNFVFPGMAVCGIPLIRQMEALPGSESAYHGLIAMDDGIADTNGLPMYHAGQIKTAIINGIQVVAETETDKDPYQSRLPWFLYSSDDQRCVYSNYRKVGPNLALPSAIHLEKFYKPEQVLRYGNYTTIDYTLQKASAQALPESEFTFESHLPNTAIVQNNAKKGTSAIRYVPGKPLAQQFAEEKNRLERASLAKVPEGGTSGKMRALIAMAAVLVLCAWYFYRRTSAKMKN